MIIMIIMIIMMIIIIIIIIIIITIIIIVIILKDCRKRHTNLAMAWIDYKKAYDFVPHSWISECMEMFGIAGDVREFLQRSMVQWKLSSTSNGE